MERHYDWERFWADRRGADASINGYFSSEKSGEWFNEGVNAWQLSELTGEPCLVLLGEAGLGKSESIRDAERALRGHLDPETEVIQVYNLGADESPELLTAKLMGGASWDEWMSQGKVFHLFLDSFDEALISQRALAKLLVREFEAVSEAIPRLRLRIACRSAEWPPGLSTELGRLFRPAYPEWPGALPRELVLAQLRKIDVGLAAAAEGLDRWAFFGSIADRELEGLAALPLTLKMLLEAAKESGEVPDSRAELFELTTQRLLLEHDSLRPPPSSKGLQPGQRMAVAERIAAATLFSAHSTIGTKAGEPISEHLDPAALTGFSEEDSSAAGGAAFEVEVEQIVEVLQTPVFVDAGRNAVRFRHRSLAEFLAASYIARYRLDEEQIVSLFTASRYWGEELIPQLREVAAWTAAMHPRILSKLLELEPKMLLRVGRMQLSDEDARTIVLALLTERVAGSLNPWERRLWPSLRSFAYPGLADTLREPIQDAEVPVSVRSVAIAVAGSCELRESEADLLAVALDPDGEPSLRAQAIFGLGRFASPQTRRALVPLGLEPIPDDEEDSIKGAALIATFPDCIDVKTAFESITPPRSPAIAGSYTFFLNSELPKATTLADLPTALRWAAAVEPNYSGGGPGDDFNLLVDRILGMTWRHLREPKIAAAFAEVVKRRLQAYARPSFFSERGEPPFREDEGRRILLGCLIDEIGGNGETIDPARLLHGSPPLLVHSDLGWLLDMLESALGTEREASWAAMVECVHTLQEPQLERIYDLLERSEELRARLGRRVAAIDLDSELAQRLRQAGFDGEPDRNVPADAPYIEQAIAEALDSLKQGKPEAWLQLNDALVLGPRGQDSGCDPLEPGIARLPGWRRADRNTRRRMVAGARRYLEEADPEADEWFDRGEMGSRTVAAYRALYLLARVDGPELELEADTWARWMPVILDYPVDIDADWSHNRLHGDLLYLASEQAPDALAKWAARGVDRDAAKGDGRLSWLWRFHNTRPTSLANALLSKLAGETMQARSVADLLEWTLECDWVRSIEMIEPRFGNEIATRDAEARETAAVAAAVIFKVRPAAGWPLVKRLLKLDRELCSRTLLHIAEYRVGREQRNLDLEGLSEGQLIDLLRVLIDLFPPESEPVVDAETDQDAVGGEEGSVEDPARAHANSLLSSAEFELSQRGSEEAVAALAEVAEIYPGDRWSEQRLELAQERLEDHKQVFMAPQQIVQICCSNDPRLISSDADLQQAVMASLKRIQRSLQQGQPRTAVELWERSPRKPKHEEEVSDWLSNRLYDDLRVGGRSVDREVLSEPSKTGKGRGQSLDIKITAAQGKYNQEAETATVIVEVKGAWNKALKSEMKSQLVDKYLGRAPTSHGIYVVLWFASEDWVASDWRRRPSARLALEEARELFAEQASELSSSGEVSVRSMVLDCSL